MKKLYRNKEWLYNEYVVKGRPAKEIAESQGCTERTIFTYLEKFGIIKEKRKARRGTEGCETTYSLALKIGKSLGIPSSIVWHKIHQIEEKYGLYDMKNLAYNSEMQGYKRRTVAISHETLGAIKDWILDRIEGIYAPRGGVEPRVRKLAEKEGIPFNVLWNVIRTGNRRLKSGSDTYKALRTLCEKYELPWEEE